MRGKYIQNTILKENSEGCEKHTAGESRQKRGAIAPIVDNKYDVELGRL